MAHVMDAVWNLFAHAPNFDGRQCYVIAAIAAAIDRAVAAECERGAAVARRWGETHADGETVNARNAASKIARAIEGPNVRAQPARCAGSAGTKGWAAGDRSYERMNAMYYCNKCGYCGDAEPTHLRRDAEACNYHAAKGRDGDALTLQEIANAVATHIPIGYTLSLHVERGSAWLELTDPREVPVPLPDAADKSLYQQINDGLARACGWPA